MTPGSSWCQHQFKYTSKSSSLVIRLARDSHNLITSNGVLWKNNILNLLWPSYFLLWLSNYGLNSSKNHKNTCKIHFFWQSFFLQGLLSIETSQEISLFFFPNKSSLGKDFPRINLADIWIEIRWKLQKNVVYKCLLDLLQVI